MFGKVIVDDQGITALDHEAFRNGTAGIGGQVLDTGRVGGRGHHNRRIRKRACPFKQFIELRDRGHFLPDGHINTINTLALLIDDRVNGNGRLARLTVPDNQFALTAADRDHRVNRGDTCFKRLANRLPRKDGRGRRLNGTSGNIGRQFRSPVQHTAQGRQHTPDHRVPGGHANGCPGTEAVIT